MDELCKELVWQSAEAQVLNAWMGGVQSELLDIGRQLFPHQGLVRMQLRISNNHDTGEIVGAEILIGLGKISTKENV